MKEERTAEQRFWEKVTEPNEDGCRLWTASKNSKGYGSFWINGSNRHAHRVSLEWHSGETFDDLQAAHSCRNRNCVTPEHLRWATNKENQADRVKDGTNPAGERNNAAKLTQAQVDEIRTRYSAEDITQNKLAAEYGVARITISRIVRGLTWGDVA